MDFFDKLSDIITTTGRDVSNKAKGITEVVKLNSQITAEEAKRRETYTLLGKMYFDRIKDNPPEDFAEIVSMINATFEDEQALRNKLRVLKGMAKCTGCGKDIPIENAYCSFCGTKNEQPTDEAENIDCCDSCCQNKEAEEESCCGKTDEQNDNAEYASSCECGCNDSEKE